MVMAKQVNRVARVGWVERFSAKPNGKEPEQGHINLYALFFYKQFFMKKIFIFCCLIFCIIKPVLADTYQRLVLSRTSTINNPSFFHCIVTPLSCFSANCAHIAMLICTASRITIALQPLIKLI